MNYLVDTHVFLWILFTPKKISTTVRKILLNPEAVKCVSAITFWEISLKFQLKKLILKGTLPDRLPKVAKESGFEILSLESDTASTFYKLPKLKNKDPFDRMLAWQAVCEDFCLISKDSDFADYKNYGLKTVW